jgi:hypothetical protein
MTHTVHEFAAVAPASQPARCRYGEGRGSGTGEDQRLKVNRSAPTLAAFAGSAPARTTWYMKLFI